MERQGHSVYEGTNYFLFAMLGCFKVSVLRIGPQPEGKPLGVWRVKATRFMEGQSHSVYEGTKPLDIWKDKATTRICVALSVSNYMAQTIWLKL